MSAKRDSLTTPLIRDRYLILRLNGQEEEALRMVCRERRVSKSDYTREILLQAIEEGQK
jgi:hypothetical protein